MEWYNVNGHDSRYQDSITLTYRLDGKGFPSITTGSDAIKTNIILAHLSVVLFHWWILCNPL